MRNTGNVMNSRPGPAGVDQDRAGHPYSSSLGGTCSPSRHPGTGPRGRGDGGSAGTERGPQMAAGGPGRPGPACLSRPPCHGLECLVLATPLLSKLWLQCRGRHQKVSVKVRPVPVAEGRNYSTGTDGGVPCPAVPPPRPGLRLTSSQDVFGRGGVQSSGAADAGTRETVPLTLQQTRMAGWFLAVWNWSAGGLAGARLSLLAGRRSCPSGAGPRAVTATLRDVTLSQF